MLKYVENAPAPKKMAPQNAPSPSGNDLSYDPGTDASRSDEAEADKVREELKDKVEQRLKDGDSTSAQKSSSDV